MAYVKVRYTGGDPKADLDKALKRFSILVAKEGIIKDCKRREYFLSKSEKKRVKRAESRKRFMKNLKKRQAREERLERGR